MNSYVVYQISSSESHNLLPFINMFKCTLVKHSLEDAKKEIMCGVLLQEHSEMRRQDRGSLETETCLSQYSHTTILDHKKKRRTDAPIIRAQCKHRLAHTVYRFKALLSGTYDGVFGGLYLAEKEALCVTKMPKSIWTTVSHLCPYLFTSNNKKRKKKIHINEKKTNSCSVLVPFLCIFSKKETFQSE